MTRFETTDLLAAVIFRHLPNGTSSLAQSSHRTARAAAVSVMDELERIARMEVNPVGSAPVPAVTDTVPVVSKVSSFSSRCISDSHRSMKVSTTDDRSLRAM